MKLNEEEMNRRILLVDDNSDIHDDFRQILMCDPSLSNQELDALAADYFGDEQPEGSIRAQFQLDSAMQGREAHDMVWRACESGKPYSMAFVDMRMPPGWDGLETIEQLWRIDPELQCVVCTAYSDYSFHDIILRLGHSDRFLFLKKPFDTAEVQQMAIAMTQKWNTARVLRDSFAQVDAMLRERTQELEQARDNIAFERAIREYILDNASTELRLTSKQIIAEIGKLWLDLNKRLAPTEMGAAEAARVEEEVIEKLIDRMQKRRNEL